VLTERILARAASDNFLFEPFRLDRRGLFRRRGRLPLNSAGAPRTSSEFGDRAGELVSKEEIIAAVWPGTVVEDSNLTFRISALRRSMSDQPREVTSKPFGRGYRSWQR
jgi:DNA-binding response OmpR family regulator